MDYCDDCDGEVVSKNVGSKMIAYCLDCKKSIEFGEEAQKKAITKQETMKKMYVKCDYCHFEFTDFKNVNADRETHMYEEHSEEYAIEQAGYVELIRIAAHGEFYKLSLLAVNMIDNNQDLQEVVIQAFDTRIKVKAIERINDRFILNELLDSSKSVDIRTIIVRRREIISK